MQFIYIKRLGFCRIITCYHSTSLNLLICFTGRRIKICLSYNVSIWNNLSDIDIQFRVINDFKIQVKLRTIIENYISIFFRTTLNIHNLSIDDISCIVRVLNNRFHNTLCRIINRICSYNKKSS